MAKQSLPSVDVNPGQEVRLQKNETVTSVDNATALQQVGEAYREHVASEGYVSRRVDVKLSRAAAVKLRDKTRQLQDSGAKTADGRFVTNRTQAVQWIIENEVVI